MTRTPHTGDGSSSTQFPLGAAETARLIRSRDWSATPLGPTSRWPETLRMSLQNALNTTFPISILWGDELYQFYNDVYAHVMMGDKHPLALGRPVRDNWPEFWDDIQGPLNEVKSRGGPIHQQEMSLYVEREQTRREVFFSFSFAPIYEPDGDVQGVLVSVADTTERVIHRRRLQSLGDLGLALSKAADPDDILYRTNSVLEDNERDIPFSLIYTQSDDSPNRARLVASTRLGPDNPWCPSWIELPSTSDDPIAEIIAGGQPRVIDLHNVFGLPPNPPHLESSTQALAVPIVIGLGTDTRPVGCFIFGISPQLPFDDAYRDFLVEMARNATISYDNALQKQRQLDTVRIHADLARQRIETGQFKDRARLLDSIEQSFYAIDRDWRIVYVNKAAREATYWASKKIVGQRLFDAISRLEETPLYDSLRRTMDTGEPVEIEFRYPVNEHIYLVRAFPWEDGVAATSRDVTEQRRTQQALEQTEAKFQAVVEASMDVIAIIDTRARLLFLSPSTDKVLGRSPDELLGTSLLDLLPDEGVQKFQQALDQLVDGPRESTKTQVRFQHPDRSDQRDFWLSIRARNLLERDGIEGILLNIRDITDTKDFESKLVAAKERAEEITRLKSSILTNMSHEIRTPLTSMIGMASVLASHISDDEQAKLARKIELSGLRLGQTLDSVLTLAKIEGEAYDVELQNIDLEVEAQTAVQSLHKLAADKGLKLELVPRDTPTVCADPTFLTSILNNLIGNAIKFTESGQITVRLREDDHRGMILVEDTGVGIDEEFLPHIFEEFRQESTGLARSHGGTGLGLTIAKRMTEAMGGELTVCSAKGAGSTFTVAIPKSKTQQPPHKPPAEAPRRASTNAPPARPAVLVVEDDESIQFVLQQLLNDDFEPTLVSNAESALDLAEKKDFDLVLLDIGLPDMDGIEALGRLRQIPGYEDRPIVAVTGYALPDDTQRAADKRFTARISKPFIPSELLEQLMELV